MQTAITHEKWKRFWESLTTSQKDEIRSKAIWEHMTLYAVGVAWFSEQIAEWEGSNGKA